MYWRCSVESKPALKGNRRVLFQNNNDHNATKANRRTRSNSVVVHSLKMTRHRSAPPAIPIITIHNGHSFFSASNVCAPPAMELPGPGVFAQEPNAACGQEEPASDTSQLSSLRKRRRSAVKVSQSAGGPL